MTKTQARKVLNELYSKGVLGKLDGVLCEAIEELESVYADMEETKDNIEPYENKDDLTEQQQERYDWFEELCSDLEELRDSLDTMQSDLADYQEKLENRE